MNLRFPAIACAVLCAVQLGCSVPLPERVSSVSDDGGGTAEGTLANGEGEEGSAATQYSADEFSALNGVYCLASDGTVATPCNEVAEFGFYGIDAVSKTLWADEAKGEDVGIYLFADYSGRALTEVSRSSGEQLVIMGDVKYLDTDSPEYRKTRVERVVGSYFFSGEPDGEGNNHSFYIDELNGINIEGMNWKEVASTFENQGLFYASGNVFSTQPTQVTWGQFQGTDWVEGTLDLTVPCYVARYSYEARNSNDDSPVEPVYYPYERTKNGYFVLDTSSLPAGIYYMRAYYEGYEDQRCFVFRLL